MFSCSVMSDSLWPHGLQHARLPCPSLSPSLLRFTSIESVMLSNHLVLCHPLLLLPSVFPSIRVFADELALHIRWPNYRSFSFSLSNDYTRLISFKIDWFALLVVQRLFSSIIKRCLCTQVYLALLVPEWCNPTVLDWGDSVRSPGASGSIWRCFLVVPQLDGALC